MTAIIPCETPGRYSPTCACAYCKRKRRAGEAGGRPRTRKVLVPSDPRSPAPPRSAPDTGTMLAIDPSIRSCGVALFKGGMLTAVTTIAGRPLEGDTDATRCLRVATEIVSWVGIKAPGAPPRSLIVEWSQIYRAARSKGDPNDLVGLAGVAMAVAGMLQIIVLARQETFEVISAQPDEWAGQLPKMTSGSVKESPRASRIESRLIGPELEVWSSVRGHDAIDAIGIGLHLLGRFERRRVFHGAAVE